MILAGIHPVAEALRATHWYDLREWTTTGPGGAPQ